MNFCVEGQDKSTTIKEFKIVEDTIIIIFLDGSTQEMPYTEENRRKTIDLMLKQARFRESLANHSKIKSEVISVGTLCALGEAAGVGMDAFAVDLFSKYPGTLAELFGFFFAVCGSSLLLLMPIEMSGALSEPKELEKYRKYLENINYDSDEIYNDELNINTIDNYSLRKVKKWAKEKSK